MGARSVKALVLAGALAASGCSVSEFAAERAEATPNVCEVDADCGSQGRCLSGTCRGTAGMFTSVLLEITPPTDAPPVQDGTPIPIAGVRFFKLVHGLSPGGGFQNIALDHVAHVTGNITPVGSGESIAARVTFTPTERLLGLSTPPL